MARAVKLGRIVTSAIAMLTVCPAAAFATATVVLDAVDSGIYFANGSKSAAPLSYTVGKIPLVPEARNFFVFDLSGIQDEINSASLRLYNPGYYSTQPSETLGLWDFTSSVVALRNGSGGVGVYADLGSGTSYGTHVFTVADEDQLVTLPLNAAALEDLQLADELFTIGGSLLTYDGLGEALFAFGGPSAPDHTRQLVLELVPEPSSSLLLASGLAGVACWRRRVTRDANQGCG